jgi:heme-degrading monooxygenase HmoA
MIECDVTYDVLPGVDLKAYGAWAKKTAEAMARQPGVMEFRASRNVLGTPQVRTSVMWKSLAEWATFAESDVWRSVQAELRTFATNIREELWGPSPVMPEPIRPSK